MKTKIYKIWSILSIVLFSSTVINAQVYVNSAATGANNGTSWTDAYTDLQDALTNHSNTEVWIVQGTYSPGSTVDDFFDLSNSGLKLYGGFVGTETMLSQRDYATNKTRLSGDVNSDDVLGDFTNNRSDNNKHVIIVDDTITNNTIIDGLVIEHGQTEGASGSGNDRRSGGILCFGSPMIRNCTFTQNYGYFASSLYPRGNAATNIVVENCDFSDNEGRSGGAVYLTAGGVFTDCDFDNNFALYGGGVYSGGDMTTFNNCTFTNTGGADTRGAGIYGSTAITLNNCSFQNNAGIWGCAIYATDVTTIDSCSFLNNTASSNGGALLMGFDAVVNITNTNFEGNLGDSGGALYAQNDSVLVNVANCYFFGNSATSGNGGAFYSLGGPLASFSDCEFDLNTGNFGGGLAFNSSDGKGVQDRLTITNCHFLNNVADAQGGAINISNVDSVFLTNCLITDNSANGAGTGGGLSVNSSDTLPVYLGLMNCTFANNTGVLASNIAAWQNDTAAGNTQIVMQNTILFDALTNNYVVEGGSPTLTSNGGNLSNDNTLVLLLTESTDLNDENPYFVDDANGDYRLFETSVCIDAGVSMNAPTDDVNGDMRVGTPDKGAIEYPYLSNTNAIENLTSGLEIYPNPVRESLQFSLENAWKGDVELMIVTTNGQIIQNWILTKNQAQINKSINVENLPTGQYFMIARFENQQVRTTIVKL